MPPLSRHRIRYTFWIDPDLAEILKAIKRKTGMPEAEQIRRALKKDFKRQGFSVTDADAPRPPRSLNTRV